MQNKLPPASLGKSGWPWMEEIQPMPDLMPDGRPWPKVTIVTPSFNQAPFLEESIRSVLLQGYSNLEYIIIDGGSSDGSVEIIRKYQPWLAYWVSEPDQGQSDALKKGFQRATGSIFAWINSDDSYLPGVFTERVLELVKDPELAMVYGDCYRVDEEGQLINTWKSGQVSVSDLLLNGNQIPQQSTFMQASALTAVGGVDGNLHYAMDYTLWLQLGFKGRIKYVPGSVANFRKHRAGKGAVAGYPFIVEELKWLSAWVDLEKVLSESDRAEMFRRKHVTAALYAILEGNESAAANHFTAALQNGHYPYGDVDALALKIVHFGGMGGSTMTDTWERYETLARALRRIESTPMRRLLYGRVASHYHILWTLREISSNNMRAARPHLLKALWYDPRQLQSRTFLYNTALAFGLVREVGK
jgi:glycosyltransferase involved in cell wall biosynthesis